MSIGRGLLAAVLFILALLSQACSFQRSVTRTTVDWSQAIADAHDQIWLLNIIRARDYKRQEFTQISKITGTISGKVGLASRFENEGPASIAPTLEVSSGPTIELAVLAGEKFERGISTQISPALFKYLWDQWPRELLLHLLVSFIEIERCPESDAVCSSQRFDNYPMNPAGWDDFLRLVQAISEIEIGIQSAERQTVVPPRFLPSATADTLIKAHSQDIGFDSSETKLITKEAALTFDCTRCTEGYRFKLSQDELSVAKAQDQRLETLVAGLGEAIDAGAGAEPIKEIKVRFRSPASVLYYLGEIVRQPEAVPCVAMRLVPSISDTAPDLPRCNGEFAPAVAGNERIVPLFSLREGFGRASVAVWQGRTRYYVPRSIVDAGRSGTVLTLVHRLIGIHRSAESLPAPAITTIQVN